jgi:hypothetical protein
LKSLVNHIIKILVIFLLFTQLTSAQQDTVQKKINEQADTVFIMQRSPWGSVLRSAVLPGCGQIYTGNYLKAPLIWGIAAWLIYNWEMNNRNYKQSKDFYAQTNNTDYISIIKFYQDQRDLFAIYMGLTYLLNLVDAYIDAQLFDFSVERNTVTNSTSLNMRIKF